MATAPCMLDKATDTLAEYLTLIAFTLQK